MLAYKDGKGNNILRKSFCTYFDILGFSDKIKNEDYSYFDMYLSVLKIEMDYIKEEQELEGYGNFFELKVFTDNFVFGYPWQSEDGEADLGRLFDVLSHIQYNFAIANIFIRGAIALGDLFMDENIVLGKALIEAYKLETEKAIFPRIILSNNVLAEVKKHIGYYKYNDYAPQYEEYLLDIDGQYFLNYLLIAIRDFDGQVDITDQMIESHKKIVELNLQNNANDFALFEKYAWVGKYHNYFCDTFLLPKNPKAEILKINNNLLNKAIARCN